jgi:hypothetical protein
MLATVNIWSDVFDVMIPCDEVVANVLESIAAASYTVKMEAADFCERLVATFQSTCCYIPVYCSLL